MCRACDNPLYNNEAVIAYPQLNLLLGICNKTSGNLPGCKFNQYRDDLTSECRSCSNKFENCFSCDSSRCLVCNPNYQEMVASQKSLIYHAQCLLCKDGFCLDSESNKCKKSSIYGCRHCSIKGTLKQSEQCNMCISGQFLENNTCKDLLTIQSFNIFVDSSIIPLTKIQGQTFEKEFLAQTETTRGQDFSKPLPTLLFAFKQLSMISKSLQGFQATIYLSKGDHFLHSCTNEDLYHFNLDPHLKDYYSLCELFGKVYKGQSGKISIHSNDNYNITIQPLYCELRSELGLDSYDSFINYCVDEVHIDDYQPVVNVMNSFSYFNVTGHLRIIDVNFTGVNALVFPKTAQLLPLRLCEIKNQMDLTQNIIRQTNMEVQVAQQTQKISTFWQCKDSYYTGSTTPYQNLNNDLRCKEAQLNKSQSTLSCPGTPMHHNYFRTDINDTNLINAYPWRRQTLFNMYSVSSENSQQDFKISPKLTLEKCSFENFYDGYESLIHVETDNLSKVNMKNAQQGNFSIYIALQGVDLGVSLSIRNSQFSFSRFCRGLIYYRKFDPEISPFSNYLTQPITPSKGSPSIYIYNSIFKMLNSYTNLTALQSLETPAYFEVQAGIRYKIPAHMGIVINVEDFEGPIELLNNQITHNAHFIPELSFKYQPDERLGVGLGHQARDKFGFIDRNNMQEYRMGTCSNIGSDIRFMETVLRQSEDVEELYDIVERASVIYISRTRNTVILESNTFLRNIGLFGGAITINSPDQSSQNFPAIVFKNNYFESNMAYLSGNSIYVRFVKSQQSGFCGGVLSVQNYHYQQAGLKIHNGGAATFGCKVVSSNHNDYQTLMNHPLNVRNSVDFQVQIQRINVDDTDQTQIRFIKPSQLVFDSEQFEDCNSGQRGSALSIRNFSSIQISNTIFTLNGPVYAPYIEIQYSPYYLHFAENLVTFNDTECRDEYDYLERCANKYPERPDILFSRTQGSLYVEFCQNQQCLQRNQTLNIDNSFFTTNDAGSLLDRQYENFEYKSASCIYIIGGTSINLHKLTISQNQGRFLSQYFPTMTSTSILTSKYFPSQYFYHSHSPLINWLALEALITDQNISAPNKRTLKISNTIFSQNKNMQTFKLPNEIFRQKYYGQLLSVRNKEKNGNKVQTQVIFENSTVSENLFSGFDSSLIYAENSVLTISGNNFVNNGYIMGNVVQRLNLQESTGFISDGLILNNTSIQGTENLSQQQHGIFYLNNSQFLRSNASARVFKFSNNRVSFLFCNYGVGSIYSMQDDALFQNNVLQNIFSMNKGALLLFNSTMDFNTTIMFQNETYNNVYSNDGGILNMQSKESGIFTILFLNCNFKNIKANTQSPLTFGENTRKVIFNNTNFTQGLDYQQAALVQSKFTKIKYFFNYYVNITLFQNIVNDITHENGLIHVQEKEFSAYFPTTFEDSNLDNLKNIDNNWASIILNGCNFEYIASYSMKNSIIFYEPKFPEQLSMNRIRIFNSTVLDDGMIGLGENTQFVGANLIFQQCTSLYGATAIMAGPSSSCILTNVVFRNLTAMTGSSIFMMPLSKIQCSFCNFIGNYADDSGLIKTSQESKLRIENSQFIQNRALNTLLTLIQTTTSLRNVTMLDNRCSGISNIAVIFGGDAFIENIQVGNSGKIHVLATLPPTGFAKVSMMAKINLANSTFTKLNASQTAIFNLDGMSKFSMKDCKVNGNIAPSLISGDNAHYIQIDQSMFSQNKALNEIIVDSTPLYVYSSIFFQGQGRYINALRTSLLDVKNSVFQDGDPIQERGKGILATNIETLTVSFCRFIRLNSTGDGGALASISNEPIANQNQQILKNEFTDNRATQGQGGAICIENSQWTLLQGNKIIGNRAMKGGGLFFSCPSHKTKACKMSIEKQNIFQNNTATIQGGAIQWEGLMPIVENNTVMKDNQAIYNPNIASIPKGVWLEFVSNNDYYDPYNIQSFLKTQKLFPIGGERIEIFGQIPTLVSGVPFQLLVFIIDTDNRLYSPVLEGFRAELKLKGKSDKTSILNNFAKFEKGIFNFSNTVIYTPPGQEVHLSLEFQNYFGDSQVLFSDLRQNLIFTFRKCVDGEEMTKDFKCQTCPDGSYLKNVSQQSKFQCQKCPTNAVCLGGTMILPAVGNFRTFADNSTILTCPNPKACLGGDQKNISGVCAEGYQGNMCVECQDGFYQSGNFECNLCPSKEKMKSQIVVGIILSAAFFYIVAKLTIDTGNQVKQVMQSMIKIIVSHFQMIIILGLVDKNWEQQVKNFQQGFIDLSLMSNFISQLQCLFYNENSSSQNGYYSKMLLYLCVFPLFILVISVIQGIYALIKNKLFSRNFYNQLIATIVIFIYLIHPIITIGALQSLSCSDVSGELRLRANARALCFEGDHMKYTMNYTLPTVIFWVIATPLLLMWLNLRQSKLLQFVDSKELEEDVLKEMVQHKNQFGFIIAGFQQKYLYWDFLIILRKAIMITIVISTAQYSGEFQSIFLLVILFTSLLIHQRYHPYNEPYLNTLESSSLFTQLSFVFCGLFFQQSFHYTYLDGSSLAQVTNLFFVFLLLSNFHFFILWLYHFRRELLDLLIIPFTQTQQQTPNVLKRLVFTGFACRTPKNYLARFSVNPESHLYQCAPKVVVPQDQTSLSMNKQGSNSLQQLNQDAVAVNDVLIEGEYKKNTFQSARARKHEQNKMIKAKVKSLEQVHSNRKMNKHQQELIEESMSPISDQRLNEEFKEGQSDSNPLYSMISPSLTGVNSNRNQDYEEPPESFGRLTTGTKRNSQNNMQQSSPQRNQKVQKQPSQAMRGFAWTDQRGYNTSEFPQIQGLGPNNDNEEILNISKKRRKKRREYIAQIEEEQDDKQDHEQQHNI